PPWTPPPAVARTLPGSLPRQPLPLGVARRGSGQHHRLPLPPPAAAVGRSTPGPERPLLPRLAGVEQPSSAPVLLHPLAPLSPGVGRRATGRSLPPPPPEAVAESRRDRPVAVARQAAHCRRPRPGPPPHLLLVR